MRCAFQCRRVSQVLVVDSKHSLPKNSWCCPKCKLAQLNRPTLCCNPAVLGGEDRLFTRWLGLSQCSHYAKPSFVMIYSR